VNAAAGGAEALEWLRQGPPIDGLVTDAVMPGMSGPSLIEHVRQHSPRARLLLVSGNLEVAGAAEVLAAGAAYLPKPFTPDRLAARLRELFETGR
jgi:two-component system NtrC family sensor kinase